MAEMLKTEQAQPEEGLGFQSIPETWIEDIGEAQKEAYRVKVLAKITQEARETFSGAETDNPTAADYDFAEFSRKHYDREIIHKEGEDEEGILRLGIRRAASAYLELRARMLAREERRNTKI